LVLIFPGTEYRSLVRRLGSHRCVFGIRPTAVQNLGASHTIEQIVSACVMRLRRHAPHGPYALGGWCAAGVVALEMASQLEAEGDEVIFVALFDAREIILRPMNLALRRLVRCWRFVQRIAYFGAEVRRGGLRLGWQRTEAWWRESTATGGPDARLRLAPISAKIVVGKNSSSLGKGAPQGGFSQSRLHLGTFLSGRIHFPRGPGRPCLNASRTPRRGRRRNSCL
jgi:hypothetical protein